LHHSCNQDVANQDIRNPNLINEAATQADEAGKMISRADPRFPKRSGDVSPCLTKLVSLSLCLLTMPPTLADQIGPPPLRRLDNGRTALVHIFYTTFPRGRNKAVGFFASPWVWEFNNIRVHGIARIRPAERRR